MMQSMRDNMKVVIWITAVIFVVGFGVLQLGGVLNPSDTSGPTGVIAKVNGEPIQYEEFRRAYQNSLNELRRTRELREGEDSYVREQVWQQVLQGKLMFQEIRRRGIKVTSDEIKTSIRLSPPPFIVQAPGFQTNGQFDYQKFLSELDNPNSQVPWSQVEAYVAEALPQQKLQDQVVAAAKVSEADVRDRFLLTNEKLKIRYLHFPIDSFPVDTSRIGGADIETYYKSHPEEFTGPPETKLQVALVRRLPKDADFAAARERMLAIREQILAEPDSFPKYARTYSEIFSSERGGDTPDVRYSQIRPAFQAAIKTIQPGQLSEIVREERSLHLFRLDKRWRDPKANEEWVHYHEIVLRVEPGPETIRDVRKSVEELLADARKNGLAKAATRRGVITTETPFFREGKSNNDVFQRFPEVETWAFTAKAGAVSHPIPTESGWYVYEIAERQPSGLRPLSQARVFTRERLIRSLQISRGTDAAAQARAAILAGMSEADAARKFHGTTGSASEITRNGFLASLGAQTKVVGALFSTSPGAWTQPLEGSWGGFLGFVEEHLRPSEEEFKKQAPELRNTVINERRRVRFSEWIQQARKKAKIEDFRENFFEV